MTASDIFRVMSTVAITQATCDILAERFVYSKEKYKHAVQSFKRAQTKRDKILSSSPSGTSAKSAEKHTKKCQRAEDEYSEAASNVAKMHTTPGLLTSVVFIIVLRILSMEYSGKIIAILPFEPWSLLRRLTSRGLNFDPNSALLQNIAKSSSRVFSSTQGCSFLFIYILSQLSVKFIVHQFLGRNPPAGADKGVLNLMDDPKSKRVLNTLGMDENDIKEVKNTFS